METQELIKALKGYTEEHLKQLAALKQLNNEQLNWRSYQESWSILECIAHLNLYGDFYLPEVKRVLYKAQPDPKNEFKPGWLGNYFAEMMLPKPNFKKIKTFKDKNPLGSKLDKETLNVFENQLQNWLVLLDELPQYNLTKLKTAISISNFIKLRLGDTLRVVIYHNERHIQQANRLLVN